MNDYQLLGLKSGATAAEVNSAWKKLVRENHPDRSGGSKEANDLLIKINAAHDRFKAGRPRLHSDVPNARPQTTANPFRDFENFDATAQASEPRRRASPQDTAPKQASPSEPHKSSPRRPDKHSQLEREIAARQAAAAKFYKQFGSRSAPTQEGSGAPMPPSDSDGIEVVPTNGDRGWMKQAIDLRMRQEAYRNVTKARGIYADPRKAINTNRGDMPGFHAADHVVVKGRQVEIHVAEDAKLGRNFVAMPQIPRLNHNSASLDAGAHIFEFNGDAGKQSMNLDPTKNPLKDMQGVDIRVVFGSERARQRQQSSSDRAR